MRLPEIEDRQWFSWEGIAKIKGDIEALVAKDGFEGVRAHFEGVERFQECLQAKPTYKERHDAWYAKQVARNAGKESALDVLREISGGHNDPRRIAQEYLDGLNERDG